MSYEYKLLEMLLSNDPQERHHAMEQLSGLEELSPKIIEALQINTKNEDLLIAEEARLILRHKGIPEPILDPLGMDYGVDGGPSNLDIAVAVYDLLNPDSSADVIDSPPDTSTPERDYAAEAKFKFFQVIQAITFAACIFLLIAYVMKIYTFSLNDLWAWIFIVVYLLFIGIQLSVIFKYGFRNSLSFFRIYLELLKNAQFSTNLTWGGKNR